MRVPKDKEDNFSTTQRRMTPGGSSDTSAPTKRVDRKGESLHRHNHHHDDEYVNLSGDVMSGNLLVQGWTVAHGTMESGQNLQAQNHVIAGVNSPNDLSKGFVICNSLQVRPNPGGGEAEMTNCTSNVVRPPVDNFGSVGQVNRRYNIGYITNGVVTGSDLALKKDVEPVDLNEAVNRVKQLAYTAIHFCWVDGIRRHSGFDAKQVGKLYKDVAATYIDPSVEANRRKNPWRGKPPEDWVNEFTEGSKDPTSIELAHKQWQEQRKNYDEETQLMKNSPKGLRVHELIPDLAAALARALERIEVLEQKLSQ